MGGAGLIGLGLQAAQSAGGGKGGGGGGGGGGGLSAQEAALAQYNAHQQLIDKQTRFARTNTGVSTMDSQAAGGSHLAAALGGAGISDQNQAQQFSGLQQAAQSAGTSAGQAASSGGGFTGNQGTLGNSDTSGSSGTA